MHPLNTPSQQNLPSWHPEIHSLNTHSHYNTPIILPLNPHSPSNTSYNTPFQHTLQYPSQHTVYQVGNRHRTTRSTDYNMTSSRSHAILQLTFEIERQVTHYNIPFQYTFSTHRINTLYQYTLSTCPETSCNSLSKSNNKLHTLWIPNITLSQP